VLCMETLGRDGGDWDGIGMGAGRERKGCYAGWNGWYAVPRASKPQSTDTGGALCSWGVGLGNGCVLAMDNMLILEVRCVEELVCFVGIC